jgi:CheY-like chemotaxis protein
VTQTLKSMDARFSVASDGVQALAMFGEDNFDVVLLDIEMPRMSGLEVLREIRSRDDAKTGTPLIALTAYVMQEHREQINTAGADSIIAKPIASIEALGRQILKYAPGTIAASKLVELLQKTYR